MLTVRVSEREREREKERSRMYKLLWFWTSVALLMSCCGLQLDNITQDPGEYDYSNLTDYYVYFDNETVFDYDDWGSGSADQTVVGMGQVTLVLLLGLAVPHVLH
ncbi:unnamed protein product [Gadus morhua 'NCC']